jgi:5-methylcytosine-specific restriction endonuclease McrA
MASPLDERVFARDGFRCVYCGHDGRTFDGWAFLQVDHFKPVCLGGTDDVENLKTACVICNHMKGAAPFSTVADAARALGQWRGQMREFWEKNVRPLLPPDAPTSP